MEKIVLYGDSIRVGYDTTVRGIFKETAEVFFPEENCRFSNYLLRFIEQWNEEMGVNPNDVTCVHWNAGLWDTLTLDEFGPITSLSEYKRNIERICVRMRKVYPNAKYIFATSTPMLREDFGLGFNMDKINWRKNSDIREYNDAAVKIIKEHGMAVNDLYSLAENAPESWHSDDTHYYTSEATVAFTRQVVKTVCKALDIEIPQNTDEEILKYAPEQVGVYGR